MRLLVVFTRYPTPGAAKTRLVPHLGPAGAAALHRDLAEHSLRRLAGAADAVEVRFDGADEAAVRSWLGAGPRLSPQGEGDLGARLRRAAAAAFDGEADRLAIVGTDCPELGAGDVRDAFAALEDADAVFGPAADGGYWLVGLRREAWSRGGPELFRGIPWGTAGVLGASLAAARDAGLSVRLARTLRDVDRPEDLPVWEGARGRGEPELSVVVPTLDEASRIGGLVRALRGERGVEVVVADGGSADGTVAAALAAGARVVGAPRGRARQMNAGAAVATGDSLLFLHADTIPPPGFAGLVARALAAPGVAAGAFSFATDSPRGALRVIERLANLRGRLSGVIFGDQGLFIRREAFTALGGYPDQPLMEDLALVRRARREGRVVVLPEAAVTSARRWHECGPWRTSALNAAITVASAAGVSPARLARWYRRDPG